MKIIISPAKKMTDDSDSLPIQGMPRFLEEAGALKRALQAMSYEGLKKLWNCNDAIARLNYQRLQTMDLERGLTPALLSYEGIQYRYMAPGVFEAGQYDFIQEHLRIVSGFYGLLRPFDGVTPYRLEMQAKLAMPGCRDLYDYWSDRIAKAVAGDWVLNLASREYSLCVSRHLPAGNRMLTCVFGERQGGRILEKGTLCKMARGEMVRYLAEHQIQDPEQIRDFHRLGYRFSPEESNDTTYTFIKEEP